MTVLQVQSLPVLANQHRQISFFAVFPPLILYEEDLDLDGSVELKGRYDSFGCGITA